MRILWLHLRSCCKKRISGIGRADAVLFLALDPVPDPVRDGRNHHVRGLDRAAVRLFAGEFAIETLLIPLQVGNLYVKNLFPGGRDHIRRVVADVALRLVLVADLGPDPYQVADRLVRGISVTGTTIVRLVMDRRQGAN